MTNPIDDIKAKALLYAVPLFLAPFADKVGSILFQDQWPSVPMVMGCVLLGIIQMCIGLRAFYDGSVERKKTEGSGTQFFTKTHTETDAVKVSPPTTEPPKL